ncbi:MAG: hypothetical protein GEU83_14630 [Pseudonocardiaceae bacterium]|nr:hypothetical protein [Pseudonocardiaceae bacterium]
MDTLSPVVADAFRLLQTDLYEYLDEAEFVASRCGEWSEEDVDTARELIPDLVVVIRGVLGEHGPQPAGDCRICTVPWPCPVVTTIHALLKDPEHHFTLLLRRATDAD